MQYWPNTIINGICWCIFYATSKAYHFLSFTNSCLSVNKKVRKFLKLTMSHAKASTRKTNYRFKPYEELLNNVTDNLFNIIIYVNSFWKLFNNINKNTVEIRRSRQVLPIMSQLTIHYNCKSKSTISGNVIMFPNLAIVPGRWETVCKLVHC